MKIKMMVGVLLVTVLGWLPAAAQKATPQMPPAPVSIHGVVRDATTHQPLRYIRVILEAERAGFAAEANTDSQGKFEFQGLAHVVYRVRIKSPGYVGTDQVSDACNPSSCKRVDLSLQTTDYMDFSLVPVEAASASPAGNSADAPEAPEAARAEFNKGKDLADGGKAADAIPHFKKAIELYPTYQQAYLRLGLAYVDVKNDKEGETALSKATQLNAKDGSAFLALGTLYVGQKNYAAAEPALVHGLELRPDVAEGQCQLSLTYWALKRFPESDARAQKCAQLKPDYAQAHLLLGNLALAKRDQASALREYKEYLRLDPKGAYAPAVNDQVSKLEKAIGTAK